MNKPRQRKILSMIAVIITTAVYSSLSIADITIGEGKKITIFGDLRIRAEKDDRTTQAGVSQDRDKFRFRARVGVGFRPNDKWYGRIRLATGENKNSPHIDFNNSSTGSNAIIDQAFITYSPTDKLSMRAGRMPYNFWQQNEVWWDTDINPDALAVIYKIGDITLNGTYIIIKEGGWNDDTTVSSFQVVYSAKAKNLKYTVALGAASVDAPVGTYNAESHGILSGQLKGKSWLVGVDYISSDANSEDTAYVIQGRYKVNDKLGLRLYFYHVETFATLGDGTFTQDNFPSNESSADNFEGYRLQLDYKISKKTSMDIRYYDSEIITRGVDTQDAERTRWQLNVNMKF